jgi:hypothetical protein
MLVAWTDPFKAKVAMFVVARVVVIVAAAIKVPFHIFGVA